MNFRESYEYLVSLGNEVSAMKLGLESMTKLLQALGDPEKKYLKVQVAGTNGKGSVCAFVEAICVSASVKVGVTTSPHLVSITERVRINGEQINEEQFAELATRVRAAAEQLVESNELETVPTYFEQVTAVALLAFAEDNVQVAILETGLGGRLDATTAAGAEVVAFSRIDYDHQNYLGDTLAEIAGEKAAIIRDRHVSVVIGPQPEEALAVILERCRELLVEPTSERYKPWTVASANGDGVRVETTRYLFPGVTLGLTGKHQIENAETAINIMQSLRYDCGLDFDDVDLIDGLGSARHPGRLEFQGRYLFDGAHNIGGAKALRGFLDEEVNKPITMIFGAMMDKDVDAIAEVLFPTAKTLILTRPNNQRAMEPAELETFSKKYSTAANVVLTTSVADALSKAKALSTKRTVILITGSLYLVGEAMQLLEKSSQI
jgi:dihydrofolate synthase/folylpolyglutamate synthase